MASLVSNDLEAIVAWNNGVYGVTYKASLVKYPSKEGENNFCHAGCGHQADVWLRVIEASIQNKTLGQMICPSDETGIAVLITLQKRKQFLPYCRSCYSKLF